MLFDLVKMCTKMFSKTRPYFSTKTEPPIQPNEGSVCLYQRLCRTETEYLFHHPLRRTSAERKNS